MSFNTKSPVLNTELIHQYEFLRKGQGSGGFFDRRTSVRNDFRASQVGAEH